MLARLYTQSDVRNLRVLRGLLLLAFAAFSAQSQPTNTQTVTVTRVPADNATYIKLGHFNAGANFYVHLYAAGGWAECGGDYIITGGWSQIPSIVTLAESCPGHLSFFQWADGAPYYGGAWLAAKWEDTAPTANNSNIQNTLYFEITSTASFNVTNTTESGGAGSYSPITSYQFVNSRGLIGLGTNTPVATLDVQQPLDSVGMTSPNQVARFQQASLAAAGNREIHIGRSDQTNMSAVFGFHDNPAGPNYASVGLVSNETILSVANNASGGSVTIGTPVGVAAQFSPTARLSVNGKVAATEVVVTANVWADYVLRPEYPLMSLD